MIMYSLWVDRKSVKGIGYNRHPHFNSNRLVRCNLVESWPPLDVGSLETVVTSMQRLKKLYPSAQYFIQEES